MYAPISPKISMDLKTRMVVQIPIMTTMGFRMHRIAARTNQRSWMVDTIRMGAHDGSIFVQTGLHGCAFSGRTGKRMALNAEGYLSDPIAIFFFASEVSGLFRPGTNFNLDNTEHFESKACRRVATLESNTGTSLEGAQ
jgi:hypothetical protein